VRPDELPAFFDGLAAWAADAGIPAVTSEYGPHEDQVVDLRLPEGAPARGLALVLHGGFWRPAFTRRNTAALAVALASAGWATANVEYRRLGPREYRPLLEDVAAASVHVPRFERTVAIGHSAGGHLALWLAAEGAADAAVALGGVCDLEDAFRAGLGSGAVAELLGGGPDEVREAYDLADPGRRLPLGRPQVLVHGSADDRVPIEHARRYAARAREAGDDCRLVEVDADHFAPIDPRSPAWRTIVEAMEVLT
jgi:dipeptidyl aminopeptidase/acylaminoacyl peptidase